VTLQLTRLLVLATLPYCTQKRQAAMYDLDERSTIRRSHDNPLIQQLYKEFLGEPNSHKAHDLLHTHYVPGGVPDEK